MIPEEQKKALDSWQISARYWDKYRRHQKALLARKPAAAAAAASGLGVASVCQGQVITGQLAG